MWIYLHVWHLTTISLHLQINGHVETLSRTIVVWLPMCNTTGLRLQYAGALFEGYKNPHSSAFSSPAIPYSVKSASARTDGYVDTDRTRLILRALFAKTQEASNTYRPNIGKLLSVLQALFLKIYLDNSLFSIWPVCICLWPTWAAHASRWSRARTVL